MFLSKEQRNQLSRIVLEARDVAEQAATKALCSIGVHEPDAYGHLSEEQRILRRALRAQARQLGDTEDVSKRGRYHIKKLSEKCAYDHWHRMLFARILAENNLLIHPDNGANVTMEECRELADEGLGKNAWDVAQRFAAQILPQVFRPEDPAGKIAFAPEDQKNLEDLVQSLPADTFKADDTLGWMYQFWQAKKKDQVNDTGTKIGADELPAVTQLFTEDYMVLFLLHNSLGAWWLGKFDLEKKPRPSKEEIQKRFPYLRLKEDGVPAAGCFEGWPRHAKEIKFLDPCMGSGHFLVAALPILVRFRMEEEGFSEADACSAVLGENIFGLELDPRCTQIGAFAVAVKAWKLGGYRTLPQLNIACSGLGLNAAKESWLKLAEGENKYRFGMGQLYDLFQKAPILGSLIDPKNIELGFAVFQELQPILDKALKREEARHDENATEMAVVAKGIAQAAAILAGKYTLVATNVPYLGRSNQNEELRDFSTKYYPDSKADLATCFIDRALEFCGDNSSIALVTPQNWLFLGAYAKLRVRLLNSESWNFLAKLGAHAFETIGGEVVNVSLFSVTKNNPNDTHDFFCLDVSDCKTVEEKKKTLLEKNLFIDRQAQQLGNPDARIVCERIKTDELLSMHANSLWGLRTADNLQFLRKFWELPVIHSDWIFFQGSVDLSRHYGGREDVLLWENGVGRLNHYSEIGLASLQGQGVWGKRGIAVSLMGKLPATIYTGEAFANSVAVVWPKTPDELLAFWAFCSSDEYSKLVRQIDSKMLVTNQTLLKVGFNAGYWKKIASEKYPNGLPKPHSSDPTQWLFNGHPKDSYSPLHVAVARLLGYKWPRQTGSEFLDCIKLNSDSLEQYADDDGIVCISAIKGEPPAEERLRALLAAAYGKDWGPEKQAELLAQVDYAESTLEDWLRNGFFAQHCKLFIQRPFIWHVWDGRKDGFSALVHYHRLDKPTLEKLAFTYLGDWISRQKAAVAANQEGSDARLQAAKELQDKLRQIIDGESPYDIFVRWKPLAQQPNGWDPDLNDGVRMNIRPFVAAAVLRKDPKINWRLDRGTDAKTAPWVHKFNGERINDYHLTLAEKKKAAVPK
ncbi:MAG: N-6 DNA methylase [Elusimicrobiota bacterium]